MKAAVISLGSKSSKMIIEAMKHYFDSVDDIDLRDIEVNISGGDLDVLVKGKPIGKYSCIYVRGSGKYATLLTSITTSFYGKMYVPIEPRSFATCHDKLLTQLALKEHNVPTPKTYLASSTNAAKKILEAINYPIIMKFPSGTHGKGVMYAESYATASSLLDALTVLKQPVLIQEYIETGGVDIRVLTVDSRVVAAMKREAVKGEKRANIHAGGIGKAFEPDAYTKKIAIMAAKAVGSEVCAVDILEGAKGPVVIEVNLSPGLQGITAVTKIDVADKIAKYLYATAKDYKDSGKKEGTAKIFEELGIAQPKDAAREILSTLDFRANRVLLPEIITGMGSFNEKDEYLFKVEKGRLILETTKVENKK